MPQRVACLGGSYGNVPALTACLRDVHAQGCDTLAFLGDALGCCGHSDEILSLVREHFDVLVAGNHEQQAARGAETCGCGYADPEDERVSCLAHQHAMTSLSEANQRWLGTWPDTATLETSAGRLLLCHGSPDRTNEFLYENTLDEARLRGWLEEAGAVGLVCTHTGLPWVRRLEGGRFAVNCGVVGKPDHDGEPAVHYAVLDLSAEPAGLEIRRVIYDHEAWAAQLEREGVDPVFIQPLRTGWWTTGVASLPGKMRAPFP